MPKDCDILCCSLCTSWKGVRLPSPRLWLLPPASASRFLVTNTALSFICTQRNGQLFAKNGFCCTQRSVQLFAKNEFCCTQRSGQLFAKNRFCCTQRSGQLFSKNGLCCTQKSGHLFCKEWVGSHYDSQEVSQDNWLLLNVTKTLLKMQ